MNTGDIIRLKNRELTVEACKQCGALMVNIDADELEKGDLTFLKSLGVRISNPETTKPICISCEYKTFGRRVAEFFESSDDNDDDSSFFHPSSGGFLGGSSYGGFGGFGSSGGFGGFGGGHFAGGGSSRGF